jgi:hypothetical protein
MKKLHWRYKFRFVLLDLKTQPVRQWIPPRIHTNYYLLHVPECITCLYDHVSVFASLTAPAFSINVNVAPSFPAFDARATGGSADEPNLPAIAILLANVEI